MRARWVPRATAAVLAACLGLSGCGFAPVYGTGGPSGHANAAATTALSSTTVEVLGERSNQLLRQALQTRLERFGGKAKSTYVLTAPYGFAEDIAGVDVNTNVTRIRISGTSNWVLRDASSHAVVTSGMARAVSGVNIFDSQFFATTQEIEVEQRMMAETLADQIVSQIATYFDAKAG